MRYQETIKNLVSIVLAFAVLYATKAFFFPDGFDIDSRKDLLKAILALEILVFSGMLIPKILSEIKVVMDWLSPTGREEQNAHSKLSWLAVFSGLIFSVLVVMGALTWLENPMGHQPAKVL